MALYEKLNSSSVCEEKINNFREFEEVDSKSLASFLHLIIIFNYWMSEEYKICNHTVFLNK